MVAKEDYSTRVTINEAKVKVARAPIRNRASLIQYSGETLGRRFLLEAPETIIGRAPDAAIFLPDDSVSREHAKIFARGDVIEVEDLGSSNGTYIHHKRIKSRTPLRDGEILRVGTVLLKFFAHENIESAFHDKIYRLAYLDADTQLYNKKYLLETLDSEFRLCRGYGRALSLIYYDLDLFKAVNDVHGHNCGDFILRESAKIAKSCMRTTDILARFGGEEFVAILPNADNAIALELAERMRKAIEDYQFVFDGKKIKLTISIGISESRPSFKTYTDLLDDADRKLYQSKNAGRNRTTA